MNLTTLSNVCLDIIVGHCCNDCLFSNELVAWVKTWSANAVRGIKSDVLDLGGITPSSIAVFTSAGNDEFICWRSQIASVSKLYYCRLSWQICCINPKISSKLSMGTVLM